MASTWRRLQRSGAAERFFGYGSLIALAAFCYTSINWEFLSYLEFSIVYQYRLPLLKGLGMTLVITASTVVIGYVSGVLLAILYQIPFKPLRWVIAVHVEIWRNTPLLVQLFWVHFALPVLTGVSTSVLVSGIIAMSLQGERLSHRDRAGGGSTRCPRASGRRPIPLALPAPTVWLTIVLPQAMKIMIPPLANTAISFFKASTVLSLISVGELMTISNTIANFTFKQIEVLTAVGVVFFVLGYAFSGLTYKLENVLQRAER